MSATFNPYVQWLGIDPNLAEPTYYDLFQIHPKETNEHVITQAADRAISKVRGCRPGEHAAQWAELLDTLRGVKACLLDRERRAAYDQYLRHEQPAASPSAMDLGAHSTSAPTGPNHMYPPGMGGNVVQPMSNATSPPATPALVASTRPVDVPILEAATPDPIHDIPSYAAPVHYGVPIQPQTHPVASTPAVSSTPIYPGLMAVPVQSVPMPQMPVAATLWTSPLPPQPAALDPMAPVAPMGHVMDAPQQSYSPNPYAAAMPYQPNPMAPVVPDPMAPVASPIPYGYAAPFAAPTANLFQSQYDPAQRLIAPADTAEETPGPDIKGKSSPRMMANEQKQRSMQTPMILALGTALFAMFAYGVIVTLQKNQSTEIVDNSDPNSTPTTPSIDKQDGTNVAKQDLDKPPTDTPTQRPPRTPTVEGPKPNTNPDTSTTPTITPMPMPDPTTSPTPIPVPPVVTTTPMPVPTPVPVVKPTRDEVVALAKSLMTARIALYEKNIEVADEELKKAAPLAKMPEHKAKLERLQEITRHLHEFWDAVAQGTSKLNGGDVLDYKGIPVAIVEATPTKVIYRINGQNNTRAIRDLGEGLAILIANQVLVEEDPTTKIIKGALFAVKFNKDSPEYKAEALQLWQQAALAGEDVDHLIQFLDDEYDLVKDLDAS